MKDSGLQWVGKIPAEWEVAPLYSTVRQVKKLNVGNRERNLLSLSYGRIKRKDIDMATGLVPASYAGYNIIESGDIVLRLTDLQNDKKSIRVGLSKERGIVTSAYVTIRPDGKVSSDYLAYSILAFDIAKGFYGIGSGVRQGLTYDEVKKLKFQFPPLPEQEAIAAFLDSVTGKIDDLRGKLKREIDRLEDYKKSAITKAVCHGLDPKAKMKDSGVAWCPKVPSHWKRVNPRALFSQRTRRAMRGERQLAATQRYGVIYQDDYMRRENQSLVLVDKGFSILKHVEPGDFVISMRSFQGGLEYSENRGSISSAYTMIYGNPVRAENRFYRWFFKSSKYINALQSTSNLTREGQAMRFANFTSIPLFDIPLDEQRRIADYLDGMAKRVNAIIEKRKRQLDALDKLKRTVVYDYVTGKREVPR